MVIVSSSSDEYEGHPAICQTDTDGRLKYAPSIEVCAFNWSMRFNWSMGLQLKYAPSIEVRTFNFHSQLREHILIKNYD